MNPNMPQCETLEEVENAENLGFLLVNAICCRCGESWISLIPNAKQVVNTGCLICNDNFEPTIIMRR